MPTAMSTRIPIELDRVQTIRRQCPGLDVLTDEEVASLRMCFDDETGRFQGIFFFGPGDRVCTFGELDKAAAVRILQDRIEEELKGSEYARMIERYARRG